MEFIISNNLQSLFDFKVNNNNCQKEKKDILNNKEINKETLLYFKVLINNMLDTLVIKTIQLFALPLTLIFIIIFAWIMKSQLI